MCVAVRPSRFEWVGSWLLLRLLGPWPCLMVMPATLGLRPGPARGPASAHARDEGANEALH